MNKIEMAATYLINAPREEVFKAYSDPNLIPRWWGPERLTTTVAKMDFKAGGAWRFVQKDKDGKEYGFHGTYEEIVAPRLIAQTFEYEGRPGEVLNTVTTFESAGGGTRITVKTLFPSAADRDAMLKEGMKEGQDESMERLTNLVSASTC